MEDTLIIELYFQRSEEALTRSSEKYGGYCMAVAQRILPNRQDSEECVNDTWLGAWNAIPPTRPHSLPAFFGRITRNLAVDRVRRRAFRRVAVIAAVVAGAALLTGSALTVSRVWFPSSFENRTEHSAAIYEIEPFKMSIDLPEGCVITTEFQHPEDTQSGWSPMDIQLNGESVGTADYNIFEIYPDSPPIHEGNFYRMVYNQLMLGVQGNWNNDYTVVKQDEVSENAVTKISVIAPEVFGSGRPPEQDEISYQPGILAFNTDLLVYVNIRFDEGVFTDEQIEDIARSIVLSR